MNHPTETVRTFAQGYLYALRDTLTAPSDIDTWMLFGDYHLNLCGSYYIESAPENGLMVYAYPRDWAGTLPEPLFTVTVNAI